jgi:hypothetical protein
VKSGTFHFFKVLEKRTGLSIKVFLQKCIKLLKKKTLRDILSGIGELLTSQQKRWIKENLLNEVTFLLKVELDQIKNLVS